MNPTSPSRTPISLPKRRRSSHSPPLRLSTNLPPHVPSLDDDEDAVGESPRTKVASRFERLQLDSGGGVSKLNLAQSTPTPCRAAASGDAGISRKRKKATIADVHEIPETPQHDTVIFNAQPSVAWCEVHKPVVFKGLPVHRAASPKPAKTHPLDSPPSESSTESRRPTTPPLFGSEGVAGTVVEAAIVDPIRAALTWHDDEITGHNLDDPDDDGEGINGIGFKPTAAQAEARAQRRKQQLAEYRSRESKEARAKRSERRRGNNASARNTAISEADTARKVRFSDAESNTMIETI